MIKANCHTFNIYKQALKGKKGLYAYYLDDRCLYVGAAQDLWKRGLRIYRNDAYWNFNKLLNAIVRCMSANKIKVRFYLIPRKSLERAEKDLSIKLKPFCWDCHHPYRPFLKRKDSL